MKIKSSTTLLILLMTGIAGTCFLSIIIWGQYYDTPPYYKNNIEFFLSLFCFPIPLLIISGAFILIYGKMRKRNSKELCLWHSWRDCRCINCGELNHIWDGCKCTKCGKIKYEYNDSHDWDGCKCKNCGTPRHEEEYHDWDGCKCKNCKKTRDEGQIWGDLQEETREEWYQHQDTHRVRVKFRKCLKCNKEKIIEKV